jgi:hypothetical protein
MIYQGRLIGRDGERDVEIAWDSDTGEFSGKDGEAVARFVSATHRSGYVELIPCLKHRFKSDKLTPEEVGSILLQLWDVRGIFPLIDFDPSIPNGAVS